MIKSPKANEKVLEGASVILYVSKGKENLRNAQPCGYD